MKLSVVSAGQDLYTNIGDTGDTDTFVSNRISKIPF